MSDYIADHVALALARLKQQFKDKPNVEALLTAVAGAAQPLEDVLYAMLTERQVSTAQGAQLDVLGRVVGQLRNGMEDDIYRRYIQARIAANRSRGTTEDIYRVIVSALGDPDAPLTLHPEPPAAFTLFLDEETADDVANALIDLLLDSKSAGVRALLQTLTEPPEDMFTLSEMSSFVTDTDLGMGDWFEYTGGELSDLRDDIRIDPTSPIRFPDWPSLLSTWMEVDADFSAWWRPTNASGDTTDEMGNFDLSPVSTPSQGVSDADLGLVVEFADVSTDSLDAQTSSDLEIGTSDFLWVWCGRILSLPTPVAQNRSIMSKRLATSPNNGWSFGLTGISPLELRFSIDSGPGSARATHQVLAAAEDVPMLAAGVLDRAANELRLYLAYAGEIYEETATGLGNADLTTSATFSIGQGFDPAMETRCAMAGVLIGTAVRAFDLAAFTKLCRKMRIP